MKRLIFLFALLIALVGNSYAQQDLWMNGKRFIIGPSGTTTDTTIDLGYVDMMLSPRGDAGGLQYADSIQVHLETGDSLRATLFIVPNQSSVIATESVADSVAYIPRVAADGGYAQLTGDDNIVYPWHNILGAIGTDNASAPSLRLYLKVFQTGTEVRSSGKYFRVIAKRYY